eukprot:TRINITY_DN4447_c0_g1_i1.p1 TRINITY_DN4447_c0_g1~~TRINITY_DN4447_c0_g1_i1.p1  ORF type:complete len:122 (-),score=18.65 TRINITY_DN4447_c0_g1_i1:25-390(-)
MPLTDFSPLYTAKSSFIPSKLHSKSNHLCNLRRHGVLLRPPRFRHTNRVSCSVAPSQVQTPVAPLPTDAKNKAECFGVFCVTYDLIAEFKEEEVGNIDYVEDQGDDDASMEGQEGDDINDA